MTGFLAGPISNPKEKNCYSGIQGLAWTWGGEGGWNLMKSWLFEPGVRGYVFLIWGWDGLGGHWDKTLTSLTLKPKPHQKARPHCKQVVLYKSKKKGRSRWSVLIPKTGKSTPQRRQERKRIDMSIVYIYIYIYLPSLPPLVIVENCLTSKKARKKDTPQPLQKSPSK